MKGTSAVLLAAVLMCGCGRNINDKEAVRRGVLDYLEQKKSSTGLDMARMNIEVSSVTFRNDEATATVSFLAKGVPGGGLSMNYVLERRGDRWVVKGHKESGSPHGAPAMPGGMGQAMPGSTPAAMPPGHPAVGTTTPGKR